MNRSRERIIDTTFNLLYKRGYSATNLKDILKETNLTKGAIYYHFASKKDLVLQSIQYYLENILQRSWIEPLRSTPDPIGALIKQVRGYRDLFVKENCILEIRYGCPFGNLALDLSGTDEDFSEYLKDIYNRWQQSIEKTLIEAQRLKLTKTFFNANEEAAFIISALGGAIKTARVYNDLSLLDQNITLLTNYIHKL